VAANSSICEIAWSFILTRTQQADRQTNTYPACDFARSSYFAKIGRYYCKRDNIYIEEYALKVLREAKPLIDENAAKETERCHSLLKPRCS
jgi:hypothetical protein